MGQKNGTLGDQGGRAPIDFYYWPVPCGWKVAIMLEECGLPFTLKPINIFAGEQKAEEFIKLSPNNKIPCITDPEGPDGKPFTVFESGAILIYLGEKCGDKFLGGKPGSVGRHTVTQWLMFQMASIGPMFGQCGYFKNYAKGSDEELAHGRQRYGDMQKQLYGVMEKRLQEVPYLGGQEYSIADMATHPWILPDFHGVDISTWPAVKRWFDLVNSRPAVQKAYQLHADTFKLTKDSGKVNKGLFDNKDATEGSKEAEATPADGDAKPAKKKSTLWVTPIENHVHAVEAVISYCGLESEVEMIATSPFSVSDDRPGFATLGAVNPFLTVPAFKTADGKPMYGGPVIYEYLNSLRNAGVPSLFPDSNSVEIRRQLWLADCCFDNFVKLLIESWETEPRKEGAKRTWSKVEGALDALNVDAQSWEKEETFTIAKLRAVCLLDFITKRQPSEATRLAALPEDYDWKKGRAALAAWFEAQRSLPCFAKRLAFERVGPKPEASKM